MQELPSQERIVCYLEQMTVTLPRSSSVRVRVPAGSSSGRKIRLRERGLPPQGPPGQRPRGDLYAEIKIVVPEHLSDRERELFAELRDESEFQARASRAPEA